MAALLFLPGTLFAQGSGGAVSRLYTETHGSAVTTVEYRVSREGPAVRVVSMDTGSTEEVLWTPGIGTTEWSLTEPANGNDFRAQRTGNLIHVTGATRGKAVDRQVKVDGAPWYQIFGPLVDQLLPAGSDQREFWVVDPSDFAPHKMQVRRAGIERLNIRGTTVDAAKVHFSPAGALAPFWGADFWFRQSDGLWVTSRLPDHGAVTVSTVQELTP
ncbi:MAG TPA: hypothetical protein VL359_10705 [bacterium]|nr:hypothetical protein [bacterium]